MRIGIGLPTTLDVDGATIAEWARRAEERGFASLATIDRIVYPNFDSLISLAFAAGATEQIGLATNILLGPLYPPVWLAKAAASLDLLSGGRFTLGLGVGGRGDDFEAMGVPVNERGRRMDGALDLFTRAWAGEPVVGDLPVVPKALTGPVPVLIGGTADAALQRVVKYGAGWSGGGGGPEQTGQVAARVRQAWADAGREGEPRISALGYFGLGDDAATTAALGGYYGFLGDWAKNIVDSALTTPERIRAAVTGFEAAGVTELTLNATVASLDQVDRLADIVL